MREMKNSGIEWIGDIPSEWIVRKLKCFTKIGSGEIISKEEYVSEGEYPVIGSNGEIGRTNKYNNFQNVITTGRVGTVGTAHLVKQAWITDNALIIQTKDIHEKFLYYVIPNFDFDFMISGTAQPLITATKLKNQFIPVPNLCEQIRITAYLDEKCAELDTVIEKTKATIEEYKKLKQSVITQAVTKGIRPNRPMKDSGIEWLGNIPSEWSILKVKHLGWTQNGISKSGEHFGFGFPFVSYSDVYKNFELPQNVNGLINSTPEEQENYSVEKGDIFFTRTSETIEEVGFSSACKKTIPNAVFAGFLIRLRVISPEIHIDYAKYYFRGEQIRRYLIKQMNLVTRASLGQDLLRAMSVTIPSIDEQKEIVEYLDKKCSEIDELIAKKTSLLSELENYKKSLIYEYVTGKKEV